MKLKLTQASRLIVPIACAAFLLIVVLQTPCVAQVGEGISPSVISFGNVQRGGTYERSFAVFNLGNSSMDTNITVNSTGMRATPQTTTIAGLSNTTIKLDYTVPGNASEGTHNTTVIVSSSIPSNFGGAGAQILPQVSGNVSWTVVNGTAPVAQASTAANDWPIIGAVIALVAAGVVVVVAVYMLNRRR